MKKILFSLFLVFTGFILRAQNNYWEEAGVPNGGNVSITQTNTNIVYAQNDYALYRSEDFGEHWVRIFVTEVDTLESTGEGLFIGASGTFYKIVHYYNGTLHYPHKLFVSNDEGQTWLLPSNAPHMVEWIYEAPSGVLVGANTFDKSIFRSNNGGVSWSLVLDSLPSSLYNHRIGATTDGKILISADYGNSFIYSNDDGAHWVNGKCPWYEPKSYLAASGTILALYKPASGPELYRSTNAGTSWDTISLSFLKGDFTNSNITNLNNGKLLLSTSSNLYFSQDDGLSWNPLPVSVEQASSFSLYSPLSNGVILGIYKESLVRSTDEGQSWSFSAFGMKSASISFMKTLTEQEQLAVTGSGLWQTMDRGKNWTRILTDTSTTSLISYEPLAVINKDSFAVKFGRNIWASTDNGQSFNDITPAGGLSAGRILAAPSGYLFCSGVSGAMKMNGLGNGWSLSIPNERILGFQEHPSGNFYAMTVPLGNATGVSFWRSHDKGDTWEPITTIISDFNYQYDFTMGKDGKIYLIGIQGNAIKIAISDDEAASWKFKTIPISGTTGYVLVNDQNQIFTTDPFPYNRVLSSVDGGDSWYYLPDFPTNVQNYIGVENLISTNGHLYFPAGYGILLRSKNPTQFGAYVRGEIDRDADMDCSTPDAQEPLKNWIVELAGENTYYAITNELGRYTIFADTGIYTAKAVVPQNLWWSLCDSTHVIEATEMMNSDTANFVALPLANCPLMSVNVAIPRLRRCFDNTVYVDYCNQGTETADSAWVDVMLDPYLSFVSSAQPNEVLGNNTVRFFVGDMPSSECGQFELSVYVNCDSTIIGQTHCVTAHGFPDTLCTTVPGWSGATIEASVTCQDSTLEFHLENTGNAHSHPLSYIIIEDDIVLMTGEKDYDIAEDLILDLPATGRTWRIESEQEPGHPFSTLALAFAEGCGGFNSLGYINQFPVNGTQPSWHTSCVENRGACDPNDKQGFPLGVGAEHNIRPRQSIDYLIRFQNTGTDTAFTVMIRDTLSPFLDPLSLRPGASSHPYTWNLSGQGVITCTFNNIMLPDSNVNEPASHGFVQFTIAPYADVPLGSVIKNNAAIYFDFNEPVITNTTWHTIQQSPLISSVFPEPKSGKSGLEVWPNPFTERTNIHVKQKSGGTLLLKLYNNTGDLVAQRSATGPDIEFNAKHLPAGLYWAEVRDAQGRLMGNGKLMKE